MTECESFGIANGCQPQCPALRKGECGSQREMEVTFILSGELDLEEGSPCVEDGCDGNYEIREHNAGHPTAYYAGLECNACCAKAPSKAEILKRGERGLGTQRLEPLPSKEPAAAEPPVSSSKQRHPALPDWTLRRHRALPGMRAWEAFWLSPKGGQS
jgi:hypothetical protein